MPSHPGIRSRMRGTGASHLNGQPRQRGNWPAYPPGSAAPRRGAPASTPPPGANGCTPSWPTGRDGCSLLGESVIVDASFASPAQRAACAAAAAGAPADLVQLRCAAPAEVTARRPPARTRDVSDADDAVAGQMAAFAVPWPEAVTIATGQPGRRANGEPCTAAMAVIRPHGGLPEHEVPGEEPRAWIRVDRQPPAQRYPQGIPADREESPDRVRDVTHECRVRRRAARRTRISACART